MPRLVLHGLLPGTNNTPDVAGVRSALNLAMQEMGLGEDAVVEVLYSVVTSCGKNQSHKPFLEIKSTDPAEAQRIKLDHAVLSACFNAGLDIEVGSPVTDFVQHFERG